MARLLLVGGASTIMVGVGLTLPAITRWLEQGTLSTAGVVIVSLACVLVLFGLGAILLGFRQWTGLSTPSPVRAVVMGSTLFLAFCALETSDGLLRQGGRVFYWTSVLAVPALLLHCGLILARGWAWWTARGMAALFVLWFVGFTVLIPFVDLRGSSGPVPWSGRVYMIGVSLVFASISAYVFHALGRSEARDYFGMSRKVEPGEASNVDPPAVAGKLRVIERPAT
jgi:hypothetical protein